MLCAFFLGSFACSGGTLGATNQNNSQPGFCGDGVVDGAEFCDGADLAGTSCVNLGFEGGFLSCGADCNFVIAGCEALPACGDGVLNAGEACDDGNALSCDGCSVTCLVEACGDGVVACGEACDDGNALSCDGCSVTCLVEACGNGVVECGEVCDDGNTVAGDGCSADCASTESCGNGIVDGVAGEACDDGNTVACDGCSVSCLVEACGDGFVECGEVCDDGNTVAGDGCSANCASTESCGNGIVDGVAGEACDDGNTIACDGCSDTCLVEGCGDGVVECGEVCDDGNTVAGDGCSADCASTESCGNWIVDGVAGEACDDGNTIACDGCSVTCLVEACGDGVVECGEVCDDGNTVAGDGCSADCASTESCGNGIVDGVAGEVCDDGNTVGGDGCSANCRSDETCPNGVYDLLNAESCDDGNGVEWDGCNSICQCVEFQVNTYTTDEQYAPRVARAANGSFVVVWLSVGQDGSGKGIYAQRFDATGNPLGVEFRANTYTMLDQGGPRIAMAPDGRFVVAWQSEGQDGSGYGIYAQRYDSGGVPQGSEFRINSSTSGSQLAVSVAMADDGSFVATFSDDPADYNIKCRLFNASGVALANEFQVNTYGGGHQTVGKIAMTSTGEFVVVWQSELQDGDGWGVFGQRFSATGATVGVEFQVSATSVGDQRRPDVAMADDGSFMAVWVNGSLVTDDWDVFGRRFGISGAPLGPDFQINTFTGMIDTYPYIDMGGDGRSVVTWPSPDTDGDANGAYARYYDSNGLALGPEFLLNLYTAGYQSWPFAAVNDDGSAWIFWHSGEQDGSQKGIFGRRFDSSGVGLCRGL